MGTETWPPPIADGTEWETIVTLDDAGERVPVKVRSARLWGSMVLIDATGDVFCDGCCQMVDVGTLGRRPNQHRIGLFRGGMTSPLLPMGDDPPPFEGRQDPPPAPGEPWPA
jgi:hypothetical protein